MDDEKTAAEAPPTVPWAETGGDQGSDEPTVDDLINQGALLTNGIATYKEKIKELEKELAGVNETLIPLAKFRKNSKTGHLEDDGIHVKVVKKEIVIYDPEKMPLIKQVHPALFEIAFKEKAIPAHTVYKQSGVKPMKTAIESNADFADAVAWAQEVKPGKTTVTYTILEPEKNEDEGDSDGS